MTISDAPKTKVDEAREVIAAQRGFAEEALAKFENNEGRGFIAREVAEGMAAKKALAWCDLFEAALDEAESR